jgi:hypothetical protein
MKRKDYKEESLLMVNFCQPSHEFTFNVGINLLFSALELNHHILQVHSFMSILEFIVMQEIYAKEETFGISSSSTLEEDHEARQESRHAMNMTPNDPRTQASTCKSSETQLQNNEAWMASTQALTTKETTSKAHMQVQTNGGSREKQLAGSLG